MFKTSAGSEKNKKAEHGSVIYSGVIYMYIPEKDIILLIQ